jgi:hypothetical protein
LDLPLGAVHSECKELADKSRGETISLLPGSVLRVLNCGIRVVVRVDVQNHGPYRAQPLG